uniref:DNA-directed RNA polymerase n=1 Tax=viral metagenome TaxID=1070528 RepID=A0A6C0CFY9_9ZZZZ
MEVARHVIDTFFNDVPNPLVRHHLDSFADLVNIKIPAYIKEKNPLSLALEGRRIEVFIGGHDGSKLTYRPSTDEDGNAVLPHTCRLDNKTYSFELRGTVDIDYIFGEKDRETVSFDDVMLAKIPLMLKSSLCHLSPMNSDELYACGECKFELGGYFIISGSEKTLLTQEKLSDNMFYASRRKPKPQASIVPVGQVEPEKTTNKIDKATKGEDYEYVAGIRTINETGTRGPFYHFMIIPPKNLKPDDPDSLRKHPNLADFYNKRLAVIQIPGFADAVPLFSVFYALGVTNDKDIYDTILCGVPDQERTLYDELFSEMSMSHQIYLKQEIAKEEDKDQDPNLLVLVRQCRRHTQAAVYLNLYNDLFSHCELRPDESTGSLYRRKAYLLGYMTKMCMEVAIGISPKSDRDHYRYKRLYAAGDLCFELFRDVYTQASKEMLLSMDQRVTYEPVTYAAKKIKNLIPDAAKLTRRYWRSYLFLQEFEKSFKGKWGGKDGVSQELKRTSYLDTLTALRRVNLQMDKNTKSLEARRLHGSSWGFLCPTDNPDGHNIGMIKTLAMFTQITTATPSASIIPYVTKFKSFKPIELIHPSKWSPIWTKVFVNSDLVGVFTENTNEFHYEMMVERRDRKINKFISLYWDVLRNQYFISTDAGRVSRPLFREGIKPELVKRIKKWNEMDSKILEFVDPQETEALRVSFAPFSDIQLSEIHGITIFSPSASVVPHSDFNQAPRNMLGCSQVRQACSWYSTAFNKRFDTLASILNNGQQPLSQTWTARHVFGRDGCLTYGENSMVAIAFYSGYNQEDSIILNGSAMKRGMFHTTYYHTYDIQEKALEKGFKENSIIIMKSTEIAAVATDPKYRETVSRQAGLNYDHLDGDGIIIQGREVDDKTVLVGMLTPITHAGQIVGYKDSSVKPKRSQTGIVDAVYRYITSDGLRGVKIRIAESRVPILGDKFASRHGQKGTCGFILDEEDMPYTSTGQRPDLIVNPHAFPSRMTIGQFIETIATKVGVTVGSLVDSTAFSGQHKVEDMRDVLKKLGYHPYGHEILYNGQTGEMMDSEIFMGPTYYTRSKLMVEDKINYRDTGKVKLLTHQPVEGRANDGGLRIGEMERDCLLSHGTSKFLNESMMERSDKTEILFQPETGYLDSTADLQGKVIEAPYTLGLLVRELESMHISVKLTSSS